MISECIILSLAGEIKNPFICSRKWNMHRKETEGGKVKKTFKDLAKGEGTGMGDRQKEKEKW